MGQVPPVVRTRDFLEDTAGDKRGKIVDRLLASHEFTRHMVDVFDVMLMERRRKKHVELDQWRSFLRAAIADNRPLNEMLRQILAVDGADDATRGAARFLLDREANPHALTRDIGRIFFGRDLQCAQCHDHPLIDDYYQHDYYGIYAFVGRSYLFTDKNQDNRILLAEKAEGDVDFQSVFDEGATAHLAVPKLPGQSPLAEPSLGKDDRYAVKPAKNVRPIPKFSRRSELARLATDATNSAFVENLANRLWAHMMGRGLVEPVDLAHADNPPTFPGVLELLSDELVDSEFDLRHMLRELSLTEAYQRSIDLPDRLSSDGANLSARIATLHTEFEAEASLAAAASKSVSVAIDALRVATAELAARTSEQPAVATRVATATKAHTAAAAALAEHQQRFDASGAAHHALRQAADAARVAAELLVDDHDVGQAATALADRAVQAESDLAEAKNALDTSRIAAEEAAETLAKTTAEQADLFAQVAADVEQVRALSIQFDVARDRYAAAEAVAQVSTRRLARDQQLAEYEILLENSRSLRDEIAATDLAIQANRQRLAELAARFGESLAAIAVVRDELIASGQIEGSLGMVKPLTAEQLAWSMLQATGRLDALRDELESQYKAEQQAAWRARTGLPPMPRDQEHPVSPPADGESAVIDDSLTTFAMIDSAAKDAHIAAQLEQKLAGSIRQFTQLFGTEPGQPPQEFAATVDQALFLSNAGVVRGWLATRNQHGLVERLMQLPDDGRVAEELYLTVLSRRPDASEIRELADLLAGDQADRREVLLESAWALVTSAEFRFNH